MTSTLAGSKIFYREQRKLLEYSTRDKSISTQLKSLSITRSITTNRFRLNMIKLIKI